MAGKFMKIKRLVIPMLVLIAILAQTTPAFALEASEMADLIASNPSITMEYADVDAITGAAPRVIDNRDGTFTYERTGLVVNTNNEKVDQRAPATSMSAQLTMLSNASASTVKVGDFTDVPSSHWAYDAITAMTAKGVLKGVGNNAYNPDGNVTRLQFAAMAIRSTGKLDEYVAQANKLAETDPEHYTSLSRLQEAYPNNGNLNDVMCASQLIPLLSNTWDIANSQWSEDATRAEMAAIVLSVFEYSSGKELGVKDGIERLMNDYSTVAATPYANYICKAYSNGILVGTNSGGYEPHSSANRAQAATIMQRAVDESKRVDVKVPEAPVTPPIQEGANVGDYATYPKEGDIINGVKVTRDPTTGVLGFGNGQTGGIYLGITMTSAVKTKVIEVGSKAAESYDNMHMGDTYTTRHNMTFWSTEWNLIDKAAQSKLPAANATAVGTKADVYGNVIKAGDKTTVAYWEVFDGGDYRCWTPIK